MKIYNKFIFAILALLILSAMTFANALDTKTPKNEVLVVSQTEDPTIISVQPTDTVPDITIAPIPDITITPIADITNTPISTPLPSTPVATIGTSSTSTPVATIGTSSTSTPVATSSTSTPVGTSSTSTPVGTSSTSTPIATATIGTTTNGSGSNVTSDSATNVTSDNATNVTSDNATNVTSDNATNVTSDNATNVTSDNATNVTSDNATDATYEESSEDSGDSTEDYENTDRNYGGGQGVTSSNVDPYSNIFKREVRIKNLISNKDVDYTFVTPEFSIYQVFVNGKENEFDITSMIEDLIERSKHTKNPVPGTVYKNENVWIGTKRLNNISVRFRINNSWISDHGINDDNYFISLLRWNGDTWLAYKTNLTGKDSEYSYYSTPNINAPILKTGTASLSLFAISALPKKINNIDISLQKGNTIPIENSQNDNKSESSESNISNQGLIMYIVGMMNDFIDIMKNTIQNI